MQTLSQCPKVLVVSINAWRDNSGINTLINIFKFWDRDRIAQIYTRSALPNTRICNRFFQISENAVIRSVWKRRTVTGREVANAAVPSGQSQKELEQEKLRYGKTRKGYPHLLSFLREAVWFFGCWKTPALDRFVDDFDADVLFLPIYPTIYMGRLQRHIQKHTGKPAICYLADDNYTYIPCGKNPLALLHRFFLRRVVKSVVNCCQDMLVIAPKQKEEYDRIFGVNSKVLTKGIDFSGLTYRPAAPANPIRMVYTGKLIIGRGDSLCAIAEVLGKINAEQLRLTLDIYTTDKLTADQQRQLNRNGCRVCGAVPFDAIPQILENADVLVFVESLEQKFRYQARLSFSTKITDYLKSGKCIFAVGDKDIAPIDYFNRYDSAVTASSLEEIHQKLSMLVEHPERITEYGQKAYDCGKEHHDEKTQSQILADCMNKVRQRG